MFPCRYTVPQILENYVFMSYRSAGAEEQLYLVVRLHFSLAQPLTNIEI